MKQRTQENAHKFSRFAKVGSRAHRACYVSPPQTKDRPSYQLSRTRLHAVQATYTYLIRQISQAMLETRHSSVDHLHCRHPPLELAGCKSVSCTRDGVIPSLKDEEIRRRKNQVPTRKLAKHSSGQTACCSVELYVRAINVGGSITDTCHLFSSTENSNVLPTHW